MTKTPLTTLAGVLVSASFSIASAAPQGELTTNGGFETGDTSAWSMVVAD